MACFDPVAVTGRNLSFEARIHVFRDLPTIKLELTVGNPRRAQHPGGRWALGDPGSVLLREVSLDLETAADGRSRVLCSPELGVTRGRVRLPV